MPTVRLKAGHVQPIWAGHPWVYAQAIEWIEGGATAGDLVTVVDPKGNLLGRGFYSPGSAIPVRLLVRDAATHIDGAFFRTQVDRAIAARAELGLPSDETTGYRLIHAEGDGLPGLIVDRFGDVLAVQLLTFGMKAREALILEALIDRVRPRAIVDRTPAGTAKTEGFVPGTGVIRGEAPPNNAFEFKERGLSFTVPFELGHKTGFYFDQRPLRARFESLAKGKRVLDAYSFVGSFALAAARGGATEVVAVDESVIALEVGAECARQNGLAEKIRFVRQDARRALVEAGAQGGYDLVVVDPPRLAPTRAARDVALVAYSKIAEIACRAVTPLGLVALCSCSAAVDMTALTRALATGARRANVQAIVLERCFQGPDHPVNAAFGEGLYLKSVICRVLPR
jgi:23S rRNA (cytosine1962-C5)-methyltransferase